MTIQKDAIVLMGILKIRTKHVNNALIVVLLVPVWLFASLAIQICIGLKMLHQSNVHVNQGIMMICSIMHSAFLAIILVKLVQIKLVVILVILLL